MCARYPAARSASVAVPEGAAAFFLPLPFFGGSASGAGSLAIAASTWFSVGVSFVVVASACAASAFFLRPICVLLFSPHNRGTWASGLISSTKGGGSPRFECFGCAWRDRYEKGAIVRHATCLRRERQSRVLRIR